MSETIHFVYLLTFANGKIYVGMSRTNKQGLFTTRYRDHARAAKVGKDLPIYHAWSKYGAPVQSIVGKHETREICAQAEIELIAKLRACDPTVGYNLMRGGEGLHAPKGSEMYNRMREKVWDNLERKAKISAALKGKPLPAETLAASAEARRTPEGRANLKEKFDNSPERRAKISAATTRQMSSPEAREYIANARRAQGDTRTPEQVVQQNGRVRAFMNSPKGKETARRARAAMLSNPENLAKFEAGRAAWRNSEANADHCKAMVEKSKLACSMRVRDPATGEIYSSQTEMAKAFGISRSAVTQWVKTGKVEKV